MKRSILLTAIVVTGIGLTSVLWAAREQRGPELRLHIRYFEQPKGEKLRAQLDSTLTTRSGAPLRFISGGEVLMEGFEGPLTFGNIVEGTLVRKPNGRAAVDLKVTSGSMTAFEDQKDVQLVTSDVIQIRAIVRLGEKRKLNCTGGYWCEIEVSE